MAGFRRRVWWWLVGGALVAVLVAAGGWWAFSGPRYRVALPAADAPPGTVATAYMRALDGGDRDTVLALSTPGHRQVAGIWLDHTAGLSDPVVTGVTPETGGDWKHPGDPYTQAVQVEVHFGYRQHWWTDDPSVPDGPMSWGYLLVRAPGGRWLVSDEGVA